MTNLGGGRAGETPRVLTSHYTTIQQALSLCGGNSTVPGGKAWVHSLRGKACIAHMRWEKIQRIEKAARGLVLRCVYHTVKPRCVSGAQRSPFIRHLLSESESESLHLSSLCTDESNPETDWT
jgi:hypothetical protein